MNACQRSGDDDRSRAPVVTLTEATLSAWAADARLDAALMDAGCPGLYVRSIMGGAIAFYLRHPRGRTGLVGFWRPRRGSLRTITVDEARRRASERLAGCDRAAATWLRIERAKARLVLAAGELYAASKGDGAGRYDDERLERAQQALDEAAITYGETMDKERRQ